MATKRAARVLIADDSLFSRQMLNDLLIKAGFEVVGQAKNGDEAIFLYEILKPDVVTMDLNMPQMDGIEAIRGICTHDAQAQIIVCSALSGSKAVRDALLAGARDFLVKPLDDSRVVEAVMRAANAREKLIP